MTPMTRTDRVLAKIAFGLAVMIMVLWAAAIPADASTYTRVRNLSSTSVTVYAMNGTRWVIAPGVTSGSGADTVFVPALKCMVLSGGTSGTYCSAHGGFVRLYGSAVLVERVYSR